MTKPTKVATGEQCGGGLCTDDPEQMCYQVDPQNVYVCTRKKGHSGPHIACSGSTHDMKTWENEDD